MGTKRPHEDAMRLRFLRIQQIADKAIELFCEFDSKLTTYLRNTLPEDRGPAIKLAIIQIEKLVEKHSGGAMCWIGGWGRSVEALRALQSILGANNDKADGQPVNDRERRGFSSLDASTEGRVVSSDVGLGNGQPGCQDNDQSQTPVAQGTVPQSDEQPND